MPLLVAMVALLLGALPSRAQETSPTASTPSDSSSRDSAPPAKEKKKRKQPARLLTRDAPRITANLARPGTTHCGALLIDVRVMIDLDGRADLSTLRISGIRAIENRDEVVRWLQAALFEPARNEYGEAVRGEFTFRVTMQS